MHADDLVGRDRESVGGEDSEMEKEHEEVRVSLGKTKVMKYEARFEPTENLGQ